MAERVVKEEYKCDFCDKVFSSYDEAAKHELTHDIIYVPLQRAWINQLANIIFAIDPAYIKIMDKKLINLLRKYRSLR
jgi:hypothetical protein